MLLADEFYFVAHEYTTGKPRLQPSAAGLGLASGLLGELVLLGRITVRDGTLAILDPRPPEDALAHATLDALAGDRRQRAVRTWLAVLGETAVEDVANRLLRAGYLKIKGVRRGFRTVVTYLPVDASTAAWPANRLHHMFTTYTPMTVPDAMLAGLASATGLTDRILRDGGAHARRYFVHALESLPAPLRELTAQTEALVGAAVREQRQ
ncbi:MAG TPA: GPP34 family phosphoprotein [Micromonosporaceae bacterium]